MRSTLKSSKKVGFYVLGIFVMLLGVLAAGGAGAFVTDVSKLTGIEAIAGTAFLVVGPFVTFVWSLVAGFQLLSHGDEGAQS